MTIIQSIQEVAKDGAIVLGAISALATALSHLPWWPARMAEFFARVGLATAKFSVNKRPEAP